MSPSRPRWSRRRAYWSAIAMIPENSGVASLVPPPGNHPVAYSFGTGYEVYTSTPALIAALIETSGTPRRRPTIPRTTFCHAGRANTL